LARETENPGGKTVQLTSPVVTVGKTPAAILVPPGAPDRLYHALPARRGALVFAAISRARVARGWRQTKAVDVAVSEPHGQEGFRRVKDVAEDLCTQGQGAEIL